MAHQADLHSRGAADLQHATHPRPQHRHLDDLPRRDTFQVHVLLLTVLKIWATCIYLEYHSVCPLVRVGTPHPLSRKRVCSLPPEPGGGHTRLRVRWLGGGMVPIRTIGEKAWYFVCSVIRAHMGCLLSPCSVL